MRLFLTWRQGNFNLFQRSHYNFRISHYKLVRNRLQLESVKHNYNYYLTVFTELKSHMIIDAFFILYSSFISAIIYNHTYLE